MNPPRSILVVGPSWVGDMVMAQSLFKALKRRHPQARIDVLAPAWSQALLRRMPEVAEAIEMPVGHGRLQLGARFRLGRLLARRGYDQAILLPNSLKSALVPFFARIPVRTGWLGEQRFGLLNDWRRLDKAALTQTVQRFVALAADKSDMLPGVEAPALQVDGERARQTAERLGLSLDGRRRIVLCPGAEFGPAKQWPHYGALADRLLAQGHAVWLLGSDKDREVCAAVNAQADGHCDDLSGRTSLEQAVDLLSLADAVVSNDSGLMHVAAGLERPLVALYGSTDPHHTPPMNRRQRILHLGLDCAPCFKRVCPRGDTRCLVQIDVAQVEQAIEQLLEEGN